MSPLELVDDRFDKLAAELRASRPVASAALRERVAELSRAEPAPPRWTLRVPSRRVALGLVTAALLGSFVVAAVTGLSSSGRKSETFGASITGHAPATAKKGALQGSLRLTGKAQAFGPALLPTAGRLQRYDAALRLRVQDVDALSEATKRAMGLTRALGGFVSSVRYATHGGRRGAATLVLRVPVSKVQTALAELTSLGTILRQQTGILDVTRRADRESKQIARLEHELQTATPAEATALKLRLKALRVKHARLLRSAHLARITLGLTTPRKQAAAAPTRFDRTLDDAGSVLLRELEILVYALVVAGPLLLLGGAAVAAGRAQRKRSDRRLLERA